MTELVFEHRFLSPIDTYKHSGTGILCHLSPLIRAEEPFQANGIYHMMLLTLEGGESGHAYSVEVICGGDKLNLGFFNAPSVSEHAIDSRCCVGPKFKLKDYVIVKVLGSASGANAKNENYQSVYTPPSIDHLLVSEMTSLAEYTEVCGVKILNEHNRQLFSVAAVKLYERVFKNRGGEGKLSLEYAKSAPYTPKNEVAYFLSDQNHFRALAFCRMPTLIEEDERMIAELYIDLIIGERVYGAQLLRFITGSVLTQSSISAALGRATEVFVRLDSVTDVRTVIAYSRANFQVDGEIGENGLVPMVKKVSRKPI